MASLTKLTLYFRPGAQETALHTLAELNDNYKKAKAALTGLPPLEMKYVLRVLRRAADNPVLVDKLRKKAKRFDNDTIDILGIDKGYTPTREAICERIAVLEKYRKLHGEELERYHCGWLRLIYEKYGETPTNQTKLRSFVVDALADAGIRCPDPNKNTHRLDDWISTPVEKQLDPVIHRKGAVQARG